ncbi:NAD(P)/FAD-dependent oxidoreductase [Homoserinimonas sp. OAct 916]|uniref:phytoene desaturase family protein n=1 Tax=Homoserinimonas sp. OAct 916 TaxID=2211450 RepID=UPI000DBE6A33|nr:FAD-dependent oxidoreductase [Homoserinimonas sp. OAct 916]
MKRVVVVGGGIGGLTAAALLGAAGHRVTLLEATDQLGGKSRRIILAGQMLDTGPSMVTFPDVWAELLNRFDGLRCTAEGRHHPGSESASRTTGSSSTSASGAEQISGLEFERLPDVGTYYWHGSEVTLPVPLGHPWHGAWARFEAEHGGLGPDITRLLTAPPLNRRSFPALGRLGQTYGRRLTTRSYLDGLDWMPGGLREIIAIHTLNAGVGPSRTPALYASMPAVMAHDGVFVPRGGVNEMVGALHRLGEEVGVAFHTEEPVVSISSHRVVTGRAAYPADIVVSGIDAQRLGGLLAGGRTPKVPRRMSCSAVGIYAVLDPALPAGTPRHSVLVPDQPAALYAALEARKEPAETMAFANYYPAHTVNGNDAATLALLLTAPANGKLYTLRDPFVVRELERATRALMLDRPLESHFAETTILDPAYFATNGSSRGALYGAVRPMWMSGPFHNPPHRSLLRPWLWRVGASVHPGGGLPAVMGGAIMATEKLLSHLKSRK